MKFRVRILEVRTHDVEVGSDHPLYADPDFDETRAAEQARRRVERGDSEPTAIDLQVESATPIIVDSTPPSTWSETDGTGFPT